MEKIETTFFHIPKEALQGSSWRVKGFWLSCVAAFALYVAFTSTNIVVDYYTQDIVMEVVHEKFSSLPTDIRICVLANWIFAPDAAHGNYNYSMFLQTFWAKRALYGELPGMRWFIESVKAPVLINNASEYLERMTTLVGTVKLLSYGMIDEDSSGDGEEVRRKGNLTSSSKLTFLGMSPMLCQVFSSNYTFQRDFIRLKSLLSISCDWFDFPYIIKRQHYDIVIIAGTGTSSHFLQAPRGLSSKYGVNLQFSQTMRLINCRVHGLRYSHDNCYREFGERQFNCCPCFPLFARCSQNLRCCTVNDIANATPYMLSTCWRQWRASENAEQPCNTIQAQWSSVAIPDSRVRLIDVLCDYGATSVGVRVEIVVNRQHLGYKETYHITLANVFSSIGGVLGFFLGGSVISLIQCGIIGYTQLASVTKRLGKLTKRSKQPEVIQENDEVLKTSGTDCCVLLEDLSIRSRHHTFAESEQLNEL